MLSRVRNRTTNRYYLSNFSHFVVHRGLLVPGGFGSRGVEGKIKAVNWARLHNKPFLGVCLGLQVATIEFARNVLNMQGMSIVY